MAKFYALSRSGRRQYEKELATWTRLSAAINLTSKGLGCVRLISFACVSAHPFRRGRVEAPLKRRASVHSDQLVNENTSAGMPPDEAGDRRFAAWGSSPRFRKNVAIFEGRHEP